MSLATALAGGRTIARPAYDIATDRVGDDVPVLFLHHALGTFAEYCGPRPGGPVEAIAARGCAVLGFDLAGHGRSGGPADFPPDYLDLCLEDALAVLDDAAVRRAAVVGIGFGGLVALNLAAIAPRRVSCVVADSLPGLDPLLASEPWGVLADDTAEDGRAEAYQAFLGLLRLRTADYPLAGSAPRVPALLLGRGVAYGAEARELDALAQRMPSARATTLAAREAPICRGAAREFVRAVETFLASFA